MATTYTLQGNFNLAFQTQLQQVMAQNTVNDRLQAGAGKFTKINKTLTNGTGTGKATNVWHDQRTLTAGSTDNLVLGSGSALLNAFGVAIGFTNIKWVLIRVTAPAAGQRLVVGNAASNPWLAWFGSTSHTEEVRSVLLKSNDVDGWNVNPNNTLAINNAGSGSLTYDIAVVGN